MAGHRGAAGWAALGVGALIALSWGVAISWLPARDMSGLLVRDDAGYYLSIARHVCTGAGWSVDGLAPTNGFNPLWAWLLAGAAQLGDCSVQATWKILGLLSGGVLAAAAVLSARWTRAPAAAVVFALALGARGLHGTDGPLALLVLALWLSSPRPWWSLLLPLARLDLAVLPLLRAWAQRAAPAAARRDLLAVAVGVGLVALWCGALSDSWLPISAWVKSEPRLDPRPGWAMLFRPSLPATDRALLLVSVPAGLWAQARARTPAERALAWYAVLRLPSVVLSARLDVQVVHFTPLLLAPLCALRLPGRAVPATAIALAALVAGRRVTDIAERHRSQGWTQVDVGQALARTLPPDARVFGGGFGLIAFVSERVWLNADGVAASAAYQDALAVGGLPEWLNDRDVGWIAGWDHGAGPVERVPVHRTGGVVELPVLAPIVATPLIDRGGGARFVLGPR